MLVKRAVFIGLMASTTALAQSGPSKVDDHSVAGNTQQAAGQLGEINKKLSLIIEHMDAVENRHPPLVIPMATPCGKGSCDERADRLCRKVGFAHGLVVDESRLPSSTWLCLDAPIP